VDARRDAVSRAPLDLDVLVDATPGSADIDPDRVRIVRRPVGEAEVGDGGVITYISAPGFVGTDSLTYEVCDVEDRCAIAEVTIEVEPLRRTIEASVPGPVLVYPIELRDEVDRGTVVFTTASGSVLQRGPGDAFVWLVPPGQLVDGRAVLVVTGQDTDGTVWEDTIVLRPA
jgi:hypothetical protein